MKSSGSKPCLTAFRRRAQKMVETYVSRKCPKSISLDSGHLDKQFGPLIFYGFPIFLIFFPRFVLTDVWSFFAYFPLGLPSNMVPIGPVWAGPIGPSRGENTASFLP